MKHITFITIAFIALIFFSSCEEDETIADEPTIESSTTEENAIVTYTSVEISGTVSSTGGNEITSRGVCWSENPNPTINDSKTEESSNTFTSLIEGLVANTNYYFKIYATNNSGTSYGNQLLLSTSSLDSTMWDFLIEYDSNTSWHADVTFKSDGTTIYDEPSSPGTYLSYGTWALNGNTMTMDLDSSQSANDYYQFTGTLSGNTMSGTFTLLGEPDKNWSATKY